MKVPKINGLLLRRSWDRSLRTLVSVIMLGFATGLVTRVTAKSVGGRYAASTITGVEDAEARKKLPLYKVIPAASNSELTPASSEDLATHGDWIRSNGNSENTRYSALSQINRSNINQLTMAWIYHSGDGTGNIQANPVIVDGVIYAPTVGKNIVAIDGETGHEIWRFRLPAIGAAVRINGHEIAPGTFWDAQQKKIVHLEPGAPVSPGLLTIGYGPATRGLTYWAGDSTHAPRLFFMGNGYLFALEAKSGKSVESFGEFGAASSSKGAGSSAFLGSVAPAICRNIIVAPNQNVVDAFDVVTGRRLWTFDTLRYPVADPSADNGGNIWGGVALDAARGIVFIAAGDPHPNFVGVGRIGDDKDTNSVIALDVRTGRELWSFQEIAHDLWDHDISAPPQLVTVTHDGKRVDAVAQVTKLGNTLLLDRLSGKPLFSYRLRRAPVSTVPGERTAAYQPDLVLPQPFVRQEFTGNDLTTISSEAHAFMSKKAEGSAFGWFEPPRLNQALIFYGVHGGAEWTGASFDPSTGWLYVNANQLAWVETLMRAQPIMKRATGQEASPGEKVFQQYCAVCHGENREGKGTAPSLAGLDKRFSETQVLSILKDGRNSMPPIEVPESQHRSLLDFLFKLDSAQQKLASDMGTTAALVYEASGFDKFLDGDGYPGTKPPWGTLSAVDLNSGKLVWQVPLGGYEELMQKGIPKTGTENFGGAMATAGGLVFCAGTRDLKIRAFDKDNGNELWEYKLPFGGYAPPATYEVHGHQYVVIPATGGGKLGGTLGDAYVAFALPK